MQTEGHKTSRQGAQLPTKGHGGVTAELHSTFHVRIREYWKKKWQYYGCFGDGCPAVAAGCSMCHLTMDLPSSRPRMLTLSRACARRAVLAWVRTQVIQSGALGVRPRWPLGKGIGKVRGIEHMAQTESQSDRRPLCHVIGDGDDGEHGPTNSFQVGWRDGCRRLTLGFWPCEMLAKTFFLSSAGHCVLTHEAMFLRGRIASVLLLGASRVPGSWEFWERHAVSSGRITCFHGKGKKRVRAWHGH